MLVSEQELESAATGETSEGNTTSNLPVVGIVWVGVKETVAVAEALTVPGTKFKARPEIEPAAACQVIPDVSSAILLSDPSKMEI